MLFESERLYYRLWTLEDLEAGYRLWGDAEIMKYVEPPLTMDQVQNSIRRGMDHYKKYKTQLYAMVLKESQEIIGACGLKVEDVDLRIYEFGIHIMKDYHMKGFGYEAGLAVLNHMDHLQASKVIAACHLENQASKALLEKLDFNYKGDVYFDDTQRMEAYFERVYE